MNSDKISQFQLVKNSTCMQIVSANWQQCSQRSPSCAHLPATCHLPPAHRVALLMSWRTVAHLPCTAAPLAHTCRQVLVHGCQFIVNAQFSNSPLHRSSTHSWRLASKASASEGAADKCCNSITIGYSYYVIISIFMEISCQVRTVSWIILKSLVSNKCSASLEL